MVQFEVKHRHLGVIFDILMEAQICGAERRKDAENCEDAALF